MASKTGLIVFVIMLAVGLTVTAALLPNAIGTLQNGSATLTSSGVSTSTIAIYGLIGLVAAVAVVLVIVRAAVGR